MFRGDTNHRIEKLGIKPDDYSVDAIALEKTDGCINFRVISDELASEIIQNNNLNLYEKQQIEINEKCITNEITCSIVRNSFEQYTELINGNIYRFTTKHIAEAFAKVKWEIRKIIPFENCRNFYDLAPFNEKPSLLLSNSLNNKAVVFDIILNNYLENKLKKIKSFKTSNPQQKLALKTKDELTLFFNDSEYRFNELYIEKLLNKIRQYL